MNKIEKTWELKEGYMRNTKIELTDYCPKCNSEEYSIDIIHINNGKVRIDFSCKNCYSQWCREYSFYKKIKTFIGIEEAK